MFSSSYPGSIVAFIHTDDEAAQKMALNFQYLLEPKRMHVISKIDNLKSIRNIGNFIAFSTSESYFKITYELLAAISQRLIPNGQVILNVTVENKEEVEEACLFGGLVNGFWSRIKKKGDLYEGEFYCQNPHWVITGSLNNQKEENEDEEEEDDEYDDDEFEEDDDYYFNDDDIPVAALSTVTAPGAESAEKKSKACNDCSCGAKELEEEYGDEAQQKVQEGAVRSNCGACYMGDAFRCGSCAYQGMPAFDPDAPPPLPQPNSDDPPETTIVQC